MPKKPPKIRSGAAACIVLAITAGCAAGPDYVRPQVNAGPAFVQDSGSAGPGKRWTDAAARSIWWTLFEDPKLVSLIDEAIARSPRVDEALARLEQAQALADAARGGRLPSVQLQGQAAQLRTVPLNGLGGAGDRAVELTNYTGEVAVSYDLDLFGKNARRVEAAEARRAEAEYALAATHLLIAGQVAAAYIELGALCDERLLLDRKIAAEKTRLDLLSIRQEYGLERQTAANELAFIVERLRAQRLLVQQRIDVNVHRIAVLLGRNPAEAPIREATLANLTMPAQLAAGVPSSLIRNRPDILAAEARLAAASAEVGVATADLYPNMTITASAGATGFEGIGSIFEPIWLVGTRLLAPIFEGGKRKALTRAAEANFTSELGRYRTVILTSFEQVANGLKAAENNAQAQEATARAARLAQANSAAARSRHAAGLEPYATVLLEESRASDAEIADLYARSRWFTDAALLLSAVAPIEKSDGGVAFSGRQGDPQGD